MDRAIDPFSNFPIHLPFKVAVAGFRFYIYFIFSQICVYVQKNAVVTINDKKVGKVHGDSWIFKCKCFCS